MIRQTQKAIAGFVATAAVFVAFVLQAAPASAQAVSSEERIAAKASSLDSPEKAIEYVQRADPNLFQENVATLMQSRALMSLLAGAYDDPQLEVEKLAAISTRETASALVANTKGKRFKVTMVGDEPSVTLVKEGLVKKPGQVHQGEGLFQLRCWKAWLAFLAWRSGVGGLCGAVTLAGVAPGVICGGVMITIELMIDWNRACKK